MNLTYIKEPWECYTFENFLSPDRWKTIRELAQIELDNCKLNTTRGQMVTFCEEDILPETNELFFKYKLPDRGYKGDLKKILHWAVSPPNWKYPTHCDAKARVSTSVLYVAPEEMDGTVMHKNRSTNDNEDHGEADLPSEYEYEIPWKPNKLFYHNSIPNKTWHGIQNTHDENRIVLISFFVQADKVPKGRNFSDRLLNIV